MAHSWIENSDVVSLFPTLVWKIQLRAEVHEPIDAAALGLLQSLRQGQPELKSGEAWRKTFMRKRPAVSLPAVRIQSFFSNILGYWGWT